MTTCTDLQHNAIRITVENGGEQGGLLLSNNHCPECQKAIVWVEHGHPVCPGHSYSDTAAREVRITGLCGYCQDKLVPADDEPVGDLFNAEPLDAGPFDA